MFPRVIAPLVTPYNTSLQVDLESFYNLASRLASMNIGLLVAGTTGEMPLLTVEEKSMLARTAIEAAQGRVPVLVGVGGPDPSRVLEEARHLEKVGVDAFLIPPPYYYPISQADIEAFYTWLSRKIKSPIIVYNIPSHTGVRVEPETITRLAEQPNIIGVKATVDSSGYQFFLITGLTGRQGFHVYSGLDHLLAYNIILGGSGGIVAGANVCPKLLLNIAESAERNPSRLPELHQLLAELWKIILTARSAQGGLKAILMAEGMVRTSLSRPPIPPETDNTVNRIADMWISSNVRKFC